MTKETVERDYDPSERDNLVAVERVSDDRNTRQRWEMHCSDRWRRRLKDGSWVLASLNFNRRGGYYMELVFSSDDPRVVRPIADRVIEAVEEMGGVYE
jgi:hypothetical protein